MGAHARRRRAPSSSGRDAGARRPRPAPTIDRRRARRAEAELPDAGGRGDRRRTWTWPGCSGTRTARAAPRARRSAPTSPPSRPSRSPRSTSARSSRRCATRPTATFATLRKRLDDAAGRDAAAGRARRSSCPTTCSPALRDLTAARMSARAHSDPRRLPRRPGAVDRPRRRADRLRGRAGPAAVRATPQALGAERRGRHAALVPLRGVRDAAQPARRRRVARRGRRAARAVGRAAGIAAVAATFLRAYLEASQAGAVRPGGRERAAQTCSSSSTLQKVLYELELRAEQPARLGVDPAARPARAVPGRRTRADRPANLTREAG